ncbi:hypothetical protein [Rufibacter latericius]|uniref:Uncharacterized protein n=1 Tax=Rufibacter latericius TaxID=2487040 RepID=A0A3M9M9R8_9BACT|nr:hypothetical protein [Rufibacter latericius]RNI21917.1 hypothetical protein EFB08_22500 [Rufibacter latericius]
MKKEKISSGFAVLAHAMVLLFFIPLCLFLLYIIITKNLSLEGIGFLSAFFIPSILIVRYAFSYADLYLEGNTLIVKKLFGVKVKPIAEYKTVEEAIMPLKYCLKFQDGSKAYFALTSSSKFRHILSLDPDKALLELRLKFQELKQEYSIRK